MRQYSGRDDWESLATKRRCRIVADVAAKITEAAEELTRLCASDQRTDPVETIAGELLPLCSGLRFIGRRGAKILQAQRFGVIGRPAWLWGVQSTVRRDPHGRVLILGTWNYPLLLAGVQAAQALAAGNTVLLKPALGCEVVSQRMVRAFHEAGIPESQFTQLDSSTEVSGRGDRLGRRSDRPDRRRCNGPKSARAGSAIVDANHHGTERMRCCRFDAWCRSGTRDGCDLFWLEFQWRSDLHRSTTSGRRRLDGRQPGRGPAKAAPIELGRQP